MTHTVVLQLILGAITSGWFVGWISNTLSTIALVKRIERGSTPSRIAHLLHGLIAVVDKEDPNGPE